MIRSHRVRDCKGQAEVSVQDPDDEGPGKQSPANSAGSERELQDQVKTSQQTRRDVDASQSSRS
jgi:hypothetical protein